MANSKSTWNSRVKKVFYLFFVSVLSIPRNAFVVPREAFVVLEFVFATPGVTFRIFFFHHKTQIGREPMDTIDNLFGKCLKRRV